RTRTHRSSPGARWCSTMASPSSAWSLARTPSRTGSRSAGGAASSSAAACASAVGASVTAASSVASGVPSPGVSLISPAPVRSAHGPLGPPLRSSGLTAADDDGLTLPALGHVLVLDALLEQHHALEQGLGPRRAPGHEH